MEESERPTKLRKLSHGSSEPSTTLVASESVAEKPNSTPSHTAQNAEVEASTLSTNKSTYQTAQETNTESAIPESPTDQSSATPTRPQLSKNQLKKLKKAAEWEAGREDRKIRRKDKEKAKKARRRAEKEAGIVTEDRPILEPYSNARPRAHVLLPVTFMLDCSFDKYMVERESISLGTQITRCYSDLHRSTLQAHMVVSGWTEENENRKRFEGLLKGMYRNWRGVMFTEEGIVGASVLAEEKMKGPKGGRMQGAFVEYAASNRRWIGNDLTLENGEDSTGKDLLKVNEQVPVNDSQEKSSTDYLEHKSSKAAHFKALEDQAEVIYLTSDSPNTLTELKPYHTYIIGGIVDKNRHKGLCYKLALDTNKDPSTKEKLGGRQIQTAKLPIGEYMHMSSRQVLATNHVMEIMLRWLECKDWGEAFMRVMPKRKGAVLKEEFGSNGVHDSGRAASESESEEHELSLHDELDNSENGQGYREDAEQIESNEE